MNPELRKLYFPLSMPHPERARRWHLKQSYSKVKKVEWDLVYSVHYQFPAPIPLASNQRIAFISDLHYRDTHIEQTRLNSICQILEEYKPSLLLMGGDLIGDAVHIECLPQVLSKLSALVPNAFTVPGNWERSKDWIPLSLWSSIFDQGAVRFLCNQSWTDDVFCIYGCDELSRGAPRLPHQWNEGKINIILSHQPDTMVSLDVANSLRGVTLALCGHTHGGQVRIPLIGALYASSNYGCRLAYGLLKHEVYGTNLIVTSGIGCSKYPGRLNCRSEVVIIDFIS